MSKQQRSVGRPTVMTDEVLRLLEMAFAIGSTDEEACAFAEIGTTALYEYQLRNPEFAERKERLKLRPILKARASVDRRLEVDAELAFKFLERKRRDEFAPRLEMTGDKGSPLGQQQTLEELIEAAKARGLDTSMYERIVSGTSETGTAGEDSASGPAQDQSDRNPS